jgi:hypothetical protein
MATLHLRALETTDGERRRSTTLVATRDAVIGGIEVRAGITRISLDHEWASRYEDLFADERVHHRVESALLILTRSPR